MAHTEWLPVVDGDEGADIYGHAATASEAEAIASNWFADEVAYGRAYRGGPIKLTNGRTLDAGWVVLTVYGAGLA